MPLKAEIIKSCIEYAPDDKNFLNRDVESDFDSITYSSSIGCFTQIMTLSDTANKIFMNLSKEMKLSHERLQNLSHRVDIVGQRINDITNTEGYPSTLDANSRYGKDTYARTISLPGLLLETSEVPAQVAKVYDTLKPILPLKDLYSGITVHPRYQNPARRYTYPGYSTQAWLESHKAALKDEIRMREVAVADRTMRRQKFQGERQKFLQRVRKIEDKYAMSPSFSPGKRLRLDAWRDGYYFVFVFRKKIPLIY